MKPNCLHRHQLRTVLVWCLLALWLAGSVQASVHGALMVGQTAQVEVAGSPVAHLHHGHDADRHSASPNTVGSQADAPCVELCLMISLTPALPVESTAGALPNHYAELLGAPVGLAQPAVPPPRILH